MAPDCDLRAYLWSETVATANYLVNWTPTRANAGMPPTIKYTCKLDLTHLRAFGSAAYVHVPKESRSSLDGKTF